MEPRDVAEILAKISKSDGLSSYDTPWGPTDACYSLRSLVNLFRMGATDRDLHHLTECSDCKDWVDHYAALTKSEFQVEGAPPGFLDWAGSFLGWAKGPQPVPILLYVGGSPIRVTDPVRPNLSIRFAVLAGVRQEVVSKISQLRLDGALVSRDGFVESCELMSHQVYSAICFNNVKLGNQTQVDLRKHFGVTSQVRVTGQAEALGRSVSGQASIQLQRIADFDTFGSDL